MNYFPSPSFIVYSFLNFYLRKIFISRFVRTQNKYFFLQRYIFLSSRFSLLFFPNLFYGQSVQTTNKQTDEI